jgi:hypothetical protein
MPDFSAMPEVFVSNSALAHAVSQQVGRGTLRKLGSRLYTRNLKDAPEEIVRRNLWPVVAAFLPGALIADRTALENRPAADGSVFVIADHKRPIELPGVTLRPRGADWLTGSGEAVFENVEVPLRVRSLADIGHACYGAGGDRLSVSDVEEEVWSGSHQRRCAQEGEEEGCFSEHGRLRYFFIRSPVREGVNRKIGEGYLAWDPAEARPPRASGGNGTWRWRGSRDFPAAGASTGAP